MSKWIRGQATSQIDFSNALVAAATGSSIATAAINAAGTGYAVDDLLTLTGGTGTITAQVEVFSVGGSGEVTGIRVYNAGVYTSTPSTSQTPTGGGGTGCTLTLTYSVNGWTAHLDATYSGSERNVVLEGTGGGSDEIFIGWRTYSDVGGDYYNLELHGFTGYNGAVGFEEQPGISPGFFDGASTTLQAGAYQVAANASFDYFLNITPSRIIMTVADGTVGYWHSYLGWGNRFATETEYPYPLVVCGNLSMPEFNASTSEKISSLSDPWAGASATATGPFLIYGVDGAWYTVQNRRGSTPKGARCVIPAMEPDGVSSGSVDAADQFTSANRDFENIIWGAGNSGTSGTPTANLLPTEASSYRALLPCIVVFTEPITQVMVELDEVFWVHQFGGVTNEDRVIDDNDVAHRVFQNCNRVDSYAFLAIKEG